MTETQLQDAIDQGGEKGRILRQLRELRDRNLAQLRLGFPNVLRRVSGFNLNRLLPEYGFDLAKALVGTEGTCVTILGAKVQLIDSMAERRSEEHTSELQSRGHLVCRLLREKKN